MQELPLLTENARKVLRCCIKDLSDMIANDCEIRPHMIEAYFIETTSPKKQLSQNEIFDCILYFQEVGLLRELKFTIEGRLDYFKLTHQGTHYFEIEKMLKKQYRKELLCNSFLLPVVVSIITTLLALLLSM